MDECPRKIKEWQAPNFLAVARQVGRQRIEFHRQPHFDSSLIGVPDDFMQEIFRDLEGLVRSLHILHLGWSYSPALEVFLPNRYVISGSRAESPVGPGHVPALFRRDIPQPRRLASIPELQPRLIGEPPKLHVIAFHLRHLVDQLRIIVVGEHRDVLVPCVWYEEASPWHR